MMNCMIAGGFSSSRWSPETLWLQHQQLVNGEALGQGHPNRAATFARHDHGHLRLRQQKLEIGQAGGMGLQFGHRNHRKVMVARRHQQIHPKRGAPTFLK